MPICRMFSASRIVRVTRGLLILLSALAIFGTIAFIQKLETPKSFSFGGNSCYVIPATFKFCENTHKI